MTGPTNLFPLKIRETISCSFHHFLIKKNIHHQETMIKDGKSVLGGSQAGERSVLVFRSVLTLKNTRQLSLDPIPGLKTKHPSSHHSVNHACIMRTLC